MEYRNPFNLSLDPRDESISVAEGINNQSAPISAKLASLANDIYRECKSLMATYGDKFLHNLMPLVVTALDNLETVHNERDELQLKLAILKDDHRHLMNEYEREKTNRKSAEANNLRLEDDIEEERKVFQSKLSALEASLRISELKLRNASDQVVRAENKEHEWNRKYEDLHDRYTALIRSYTEHAERARSSTQQKGDIPTVETDHHVSTATNLRPAALAAHDAAYYKSYLAVSPTDRVADFMRALSRSQFDLIHAQAFESERQRIMRSILETTPELQDTDNLRRSLPDPSFDELSQADLFSEDGNDAQSYDGSTSNQANNGADSSSVELFNGVTREVNNLIKENQDLVQTKNALNVVTNDLIGRIDDLTCENLRLSSERNALVTNSTSMLFRIKELEQQCRRLRQDLENIDLRESMYTGSMHSGDSCDDSDGSETPIAMRKRFSRIEMARVLLERNQYKEQLCELQDAIRWTGALKAEQLELQQQQLAQRNGCVGGSRKRGRIWALFAKLFTPKSQENSMHTPVLCATSIDSQQPVDSSHGVSSQRNAQQPNPDAVKRSASENHTRKSLTDPDVVSVGEAKKPRVSVHRLGPIEWLRICQPTSFDRSIDFCTLLRNGSSYPYTCYVRPVCEKLPGFKLWCAACVYQNETDNSDHSLHRDTELESTNASDELIVGSVVDTEATPIRRVSHDVESVLTTSVKSNTSNRRSANELVKSLQLHPNPNPALTNIVWLCSVATSGGVPLRQLLPSESHQQTNTVVHSLITVINTDEPQRNLDTFAITACTVLCMAAVPGCSVEDLRQLEATSNWWNSVPLDLSEELLLDDCTTAPYRSLYSPAHACAVLNGHSSGNTQPGDTLDSTQSPPDPVHAKSHSCQIPSRSSFPWDDPDSMHISTASMPPNARDSHVTNSLDTMVSYFIERKRFFVRNIPDTVEKPVLQRRYGSVTSTVHSKADTLVELPTSSDCAQSRASRVTSAQPTVWFGCYNGDLFVHSSVTNWRNCLHAIRLPDSVTQIQHFKSRVFVSLANGQIVVFQRRPTSTTGSPSSLSALSLNGAVTSSNLREPGSPGTTVQASNLCDPRLGVWDFTEACVITCGHSRTPIRRTIVVPPTNTLWTTYRNQILVIHAITLQLINCTEVHPRRDAQIQCMCWCTDGVWVALRKDPSIRLYDMFSQQQLQTVELGPILLKWLPTLKAVPHRGSLSRGRRVASTIATSLFSSDEYLWIGTNLGLVVTIPFESSTTASNTCGASSRRSIVNTSGIQVSRNQHDGPVRFIVAAHGLNPPARSDPIIDEETKTMLERNADTSPASVHSPGKNGVLVLSGGEGYRLLDSPPTEEQTPDDVDPSNPSTCSSAKDQNHLIVWNLDPPSLS